MTRTSEIRALLPVLDNKAIAERLKCTSWHVAKVRRESQYLPPRPSATNNDWNDERERLLREFWAEGDSARIAARRLNRDTGSQFSRCAVIGKVRRLGLPFREPHGKNSRKARRGTWGKPTSSRMAKLDHAVFGDRRPRVDARHSFADEPRALRALPIPQPQPDDIARVSFVDLSETQCKFVVGEPKGPHDKQFCGLERSPGTSYCAHHFERCHSYTPGIRQPASKPGHVLVSAAGKNAFGFEFA